MKEKHLYTESVIGDFFILSMEVAVPLYITSLVMICDYTIIIIKLTMYVCSYVV